MSEHDRTLQALLQEASEPEFTEKRWRSAWAGAKKLAERTGRTDIKQLWEAIGRSRCWIEPGGDLPK